MRYDDWGWYRYAPSAPRAVKGGIRAQGRTFGEKWWGRRWVQVLEGFGIGARLQRGRRYARQGQVVSLEIGKGLVEAEVQGSRPKPYHVTIQLTPMKPECWKRAAAALNRQAIHAAKLLGGELPPEIEKIFAEAGVPLFPQRYKDLETDCSCPDWSNPCKHIAAVYYLLGEEFDRDPFLIFKLRGVEREDLIGSVTPAAGKVEKPEPLPAEPEKFWNAGPLPGDLLAGAETPAASAALLKRLGPFPFWRGACRLQEALEPVYKAASEKAADIL
ncbi:MAG: SWIM zinc finger family protein [Bryobacteraceae bacterium]